MEDGECVMDLDDPHIKGLEKRIKRLEHKIAHAYKLGGPLGEWITQDQLVARYKMLVCDYSTVDTNP